MPVSNSRKTPKRPCEKTPEERWTFGFVYDCRDLLRLPQRTVVATCVWRRCYHEVIHPRSALPTCPPTLLLHRSNNVRGHRSTDVITVVIKCKPALTAQPNLRQRSPGALPKRGPLTDPWPANWIPLSAFLAFFWFHSPVKLLTPKYLHSSSVTVTLWMTFQCRYLIREVTARSTVGYASVASIIHCRQCCNFSCFILVLSINSRVGYEG